MHVTLTFFQAIFMGLLQGFSELFPVSSLGHSVLIPALLGWHNLVSAQSANQAFFLVFLVGLHVGTALGLIVYYRGTWRAILAGITRQLRGVSHNGASSLWRLNDENIDANYRLLVLLGLGSLPVALAGLVLQKKLEKIFANPRDAAILLTLNGFVLLGAEAMKRSRGRHATTRHVATLPAGRAIVIGASQIAALFAGISRSGVTMVAGLTNGLDHEESANFSFLLATPVILLAGLYKLPELFGALGNGVRTQTLLGALCAGIASWFTVKFLVRWFSTKTLRPFGIYCLAMGLLCLVRFG